MALFPRVLSPARGATAGLRRSAAPSPTDVRQLGSHPGQAERPTRVPALRRLTDLRYQRLAERTRGRSPQGRGANTQGHRPELVLVVERDQALAHRIRRRLAA